MTGLLCALLAFVGVLSALAAPAVDPPAALALAFSGGFYLLLALRLAWPPRPKP